MLKIKDNVDLKELEKFGLKPKYNEDTGKITAYEKIIDQWEGIIVKKAKETKKIRIFKCGTVWEINKYNDYLDIDTLYDLIKADMVEKVEV